MDKMPEDMKKVFESRGLYRLLCVIGIILAAAVIFSAGIVTGFHKATFGRAWEENYVQNFGVIPARRSIGLGGDYFPNSHGAIGKIIKIELPNIFVQGRDNTEKIILINTGTKLEVGRADMLPSDLRLEDYVVAIGMPDDKGIIEAKFIRVIPRPEILNQ